MPGGRTAIQWDLGSLEKWASRNYTKFSEGKNNGLEKKNPVQPYCLQCSPLEKDLVILGSKLYMSYVNTWWY